VSVDPFATEGFTRSSVDAVSAQTDRYQVVGELGRGAMGVVDQVFDRRLQRMVARKRPHAAPSTALLDAFHAEATVMGLLHHPVIPPVLDAGEDAEGPYYTMPLLDGVPLDRFVAADKPLTMLVRLLADAAAGLHAAHLAGVVHRDVKPANLMVGVDGTPFVVDWGVALDPRNPDRSVVGTPRYRAPEQTRGELVDGRADVYGLGCVLDELLGDIDEPELRSIAAQCLAPDPEDRLATAGQLADELRTWLEGGRVRSHPYSWTAIAERWITEHRAVVATGLVAFAAVVVASLVGVRQQQIEFARAETSLAESLALQASVQLQRRDRRGAEWAAVRSLEHRDNPVARGVLAAWNEEGRPVLRRSREAECLDGWLQDDGSLACFADGTVTWYGWDGPTDTLALPNDVRPMWAERRGDQLRAAQESRLIRSDGRTIVRERLRLHPVPGTELFWGGSHLLDADLTSGLEVCARIESVDQRDGTIAATCRDETVRVGPLSGPFDLVAVDSPSVAAVVDGGVLIGSFDGRLHRVTHGQPMSVASIVGAPLSFHRLDDHRMLVRGERGAVALFDPTTLTQWSLIGSGVEAIVAMGDRFATYGSGRVDAFTLPPPQPFSNVHVPHGGISLLTASPAGDRFLVGNGDGSLVEIDASSGAQRVVWTNDGMAGQLGLYEDTSHILVLDDHVIRSLDLDDGTMVERGPWSARTVVHWGDAMLFDLWGMRLSRVRGEEPTPVLQQPRSHVVWNDELWALDANGVVHAGTAEEGVVTERFRVPGGLRIAVGGDGVFVGTAGEVVAYDVEGRVRWRRELQRPPSQLVAGAKHVVVADDGRTLHVFDRDGRETHTMLEAHERPIHHLSLDGHILHSAGWDGYLRRWNLAARGSPTALHARVAAAWGLKE
jgi:outer membrane protein assembly factor BamB